MEGNDWIEGGDNRDFIYGKAGADNLYDYNVNNIIHGSGGYESDCSHDEIYTMME
jgi:Ca2+-binding RTX toxin-like protein